MDPRHELVRAMDGCDMPPPSCTPAQRPREVGTELTNQPLNSGGSELELRTPVQQPRAAENTTMAFSNAGKTFHAPIATAAWALPAECTVGEVSELQKSCCRKTNANIMSIYEIMNIYAHSIFGRTTNLRKHQI